MVAPGVEVHARDDLDQRTLTMIDSMVGALRHMLERRDDDEEEGSGSLK
jgi:hypothetical protein